VATPPLKSIREFKDISALETGLERLVIEVPEDRHAKIKTRAASLRKSVKAYVIDAIEQFSEAANMELVANPERKTIAGSWHQKRLVVEVPPEKAARFKEAAKSFKTFREYALRCIESEMASAKRKTARKSVL
jgi:uncharacterized protein (DUF1330 family)